jgi:hypothetical protein
MTRIYFLIICLLTLSSCATALTDEWLTERRGYLAECEKWKASIRPISDRSPDEQNLTVAQVLNKRCKTDSLSFCSQPPQKSEKLIELETQWGKPVTVCQ